jgi:hypothetical protein
MTMPESHGELENGSRATTPDGDNLQLDFTRADAAAFAALAGASGGRVEHDHALGLTMTDAASPCPFGNVAHLCRPLAAAETPAVVRRLSGFYGQASGAGPYIVFSAWPTADLTGEGLLLGGHPPMMVRPPGPWAADRSQRSGDGLRIVEVADAGQLEDFERVMVEAYPAAELLPFGSQPRLFGEALIGSAWKMFVGYEGETPVATAAGYVTEALVAIEMVSSRPECRGRGHGAAITAAAVQAGGDLPAVLVSSDLGNQVYRRLGFMPVLRYTLWIGTR